MQISHSINCVRVTKGKSQQTVAEGANLRKGWFNLIENDRKVPTIETLTNICRSLGIQRWKLFFLMDEIHSGGELTREAKAIIQVCPELRDYIATFHLGETKLSISGEIVLKQLQLVNLERQHEESDSDS